MHHIYNYTDYFGNPIAVGDQIIYPICAGSSSASFQRAEVLEIDEIVVDPNSTYSRGPLYSKRFYDNPTQYIVPPRDWRNNDYRPDMSKAYVLRVSKADSDSYKKVTIKNVDRVVVVNKLVA